MGNRALLLINIQNDYFPGGKWPLSGIEAAAGNAARLIAAARTRNELVIHVCHESETADSPVFTPGSDGAAIHEKVAPVATEPVVLKRHVNAFNKTELKAILDRNGIEKLLLCGAMSHMCIDGTVRAAAELGYGCTLIHDACASHDLPFGNVLVPAAHVHAAFMAALSFAYAETLSTDEFLLRTA
jgi:nicotinamidase-related amidase